ncbi:MAG: proprotein convertase P-domain-containing protein [Flavobacteriales bacterium]|nr:proprotein convertase P-domain-containing protein [Flavobacteriales bacterium]MCB9336012.1 proprotein convertase P-domain-containing protein [Flavobacteriales bacterium]
MKTKIFLLSAFVFGLFSFTNAQNSLWNKVSFDELNGKPMVHRNNIPSKAEFFKLDLELLKNLLVQAPNREGFSGKSNVIIPFPTAQGTIEHYRVWNSPILHTDLAAKFPMIQTFVAQGVEDPTAYMRFSITQFGLHTMTLSGNVSTTYIDPFTQDLNYYIVYSRESLGPDTQPFECLTPDSDAKLRSLEKDRYSSETFKADVDDMVLRKYRLAQTCTAEYGNIFTAGGGTDAQNKAEVQAQMTITINRVNTVYEVDLGITLEFIANNDDCIFYGNTGTDPWSGEYNNTTQSWLTANIGEANYDIGHNFNTDGGGNAGCIGCVCEDGNKGSGMTGRANPTGDPFDIDYVAHEMGHQFGGYHTMNTCSRSGSGQTEVEPCSGSSVMGYAGICSVNVQPNSDAHFNYVNVRDIADNIKPGGTSTCYVAINHTNNPPTANAGNDYTIPKGTAFVLEGTGSDPDGNGSLTYNWSQNDPAQAPSSSSPQSTWTVGPLYRAKLPIASPNRYMPQLSDVVAGNLFPTWEMTPTVGRILNFSFIVRDNDPLGGQTASDLMKVTVDGASGPFEVTSQNTGGITWNSGATETVTWNVAGTNSGSVNTPNVDIFLSVDGGYTYPYTLATGVPNNGSASVTVPTGAATTTARIMVRGANNIFYALNSNNFAIEDSEFVMNFSNTTAAPCPTDDAVYNFTYNTFLSFSETTTFSASGEPAGSVVTFNPTTASADGTPVTMTVSNLNASMVGNYTISITGTATTVTKISDVTLDVIDPAPATAVLSSPANTAGGVDPATTFTWSSAGTGAMYDIEIATDAAFTNIVDNATGLSSPSYTSSALLNQTTYYWRVTSYNNCGSAPASSVFSFTTSSCSTVASTDVPVVVSAASQTSIITIANSGTISDVNVIGLNIPHDYVGDMSATLTSPQGTTIQLFDGPGIPASTYGCSGSGIDVSFDDAATLTSTDFENTCNTASSPAISGVYQPINALSAFNGEDMAGTWTLTVLDSYTSGDDGSIDAWSLEICSEVTPTGISTSSLDNNIVIYPNPTSNVLNVNFGNINSSIQITLTDVQGKVITQMNNITDNSVQLNLNKYSNGLYLLKVKSEDSSKVFKVTKQ